MKPLRFSTPTITLEREDYADIRQVIDSGWVCIGKHVDRLEVDFRRRFRVKHAIACSNCTQGLIIALKAAGWRNKRIAVPAFTWPSTIFAIESNIGNAPIFCDIDPDTWLLDLDSISPDSYDAVIAVDTFGNQAGVKTRKPVIYDAAHGFDLRDLGHRGLAEVISFSFTKVVSASEGGMILTNNAEIAKTAYELRRLASRMEEINAIIALRSLSNYEKNQKAKIDIIDYYTRHLAFAYQRQRIPTCTNHSVFAVLLGTRQERDAIAHTLAKHKIEFKIYYDPLVSGLPNIDSIYSRIIALPTHQGVKPFLKNICRWINDCMVALSRQPAYNGHQAIPTPGKRYLKESGYLNAYLRRAR